MFRNNNFNVIVIMSWFIALPTSAQFADNFDKPVAPAQNGWEYLTGDGTATMDFVRNEEGYASIVVNGTTDKQNIWWALIKHRVTGIKLDQLMKPGYELRVEARIRVSHAPRRVNLHFNNQRTTDFHSHLMEYDIPDTTNWHVISMTTRDFDTQPGDQINVQMALMDWGLEKYRVDIDYIKVDVVNRSTAGPDKGSVLPYHPPVADPMSFNHHVPVLQDAIIDTQFPDLNFNNWISADDKTNLLTASGTQLIIMRWDLHEFRAKQVARSGLLELTVHSLQRSPDFQKDFGMIRVTEILGGDPDWDQQTVTLNSLRRGQPFDEVVNTQMTIDTGVSKNGNGKLYITISYPVLQRMLEGKTHGLAIKPLGAINASFYALENQSGKFGATLHFDVK